MSVHTQRCAHACRSAYSHAGACNRGCVHAAVRACSTAWACSRPLVCSFECVHADIAVLTAGARCSACRHLAVRVHAAVCACMRLLVCMKWCTCSSVRACVHAAVQCARTLLRARRLCMRARAAGAVHAQGCPPATSRVRAGGAQHHVPPPHKGQGTPVPPRGAPRAPTQVREEVLRHLQQGLVGTEGTSAAGGGAPTGAVQPAGGRGGGSPGTRT